MGNDEQILRSITAGARGYLDVGSRPFAVELATESMIQGCIWSIATTAVAADRAPAQASRGECNGDGASAGPRRRQVLDLIMTARSNREIAGELGIEERTVKAYVASLLRKTGADSA